MSLLDPNTPWPWLLYALAGAGVTTWLLPIAINELDPAERDAYKAHPPIQAVAWLFFWAIWPLLVAYLLVGFTWEWILTAYDWIYDRFHKEDS